MLDFLYQMKEGPERLLANFQCHPVNDFILKLINSEDLIENAGSVAWLTRIGLVDKLYESLEPSLDLEVG
jgi:hypothetical protein